jgi:hypothetical protein
MSPRAASKACSGSAARAENSIFVFRWAARPVDRELPAPRRGGLLGLGGRRHRQPGHAQEVAEGPRREGGIDGALDAVEAAPEIVEVDVLGAAPARVEQPQVRAALHGVAGDRQVGGQHLEQDQVKDLDQLGAFALLAHGGRLHE